MKICVTGGAGFIGSHIVDAYIKLGHEVVIIDNLSTGKRENINPLAKFIEKDINDEIIYEIFESEKFDVLVHEAAQMDVRFSVNNPIIDAQNNILGSINLFEAARKTGVKKLIFASSGGTIYGEHDYFPADEEHRLQPNSPYGITKLSVEKYLYYYQVQYGVNYAALRYGNVYGPRQNPHGEAGVIAIFIDKMLTGKQPVINGDGKITRDYVYIDDVVAANVIALEDSVSGCYNVGTAIETDVNTIFHALKLNTNSNCDEYHGEAKPGEQRRAVLSFDKMKDNHGWTPKVRFEEGIKRTVEYYKNVIK